MNYKFVFILALVFSFCFVSADVIVSDIPNSINGVNIDIPTPPLFNNNTDTANASDIWIGIGGEFLDTPLDFSAITASGEITGGSFTIGSDTLGATEWGNLVGLNQPLTTTELVQFVSVTTDTLGSISGGGVLDISGAPWVLTGVGLQVAGDISSPTNDVSGATGTFGSVNSDDYNADDGTDMLSFLAGDIMIEAPIDMNGFPLNDSSGVLNVQQSAGGTGVVVSFFGETTTQPRMEFCGNGTSFGNKLACGYFQMDAFNRFIIGGDANTRFVTIGKVLGADSGIVIGGSIAGHLSLNTAGGVGGNHMTIGGSNDAQDESIIVLTDYSHRNSNFNVPDLAWSEFWFHDNSADFTNIVRVGNNGTAFVINSTAVGSTIIPSDLEVVGNITGENVFLPAYVSAHTNNEIAVAVAGVFYNVTFDQEEAEFKKRITHTAADNTNITFTIEDTGTYEITYTMVFEDSAASPNAHVVSAVFKNNAELNGFTIEKDSSKQNSDFGLHHSDLVDLTTGDEINLRFTSDDTTVSLTTHLTFGVHQNTGHLTIKRIA